ncbi:hypothetical protein ACSQ67_025691 [Phaseolus vulgaris]
MVVVDIPTSPVLSRAQAKSRRATIRGYPTHPSLRMRMVDRVVDSPFKSMPHVSRWVTLYLLPALSGVGSLPRQPTSLV